MSGEGARGLDEVGARLLAVHGDAVELELPALHLLPADEADVSCPVWGLESCCQGGHERSNAAGRLLLPAEDDEVLAREPKRPVVPGVALVHPGEVRASRAPASLGREEVASHDHRPEVDLVVAYRVLDQSKRKSSSTRCPRRASGHGPARHTTQLVFELNGMLIAANVFFFLFEDAAELDGRDAACASGWKIWAKARGRTCRKLGLVPGVRPQHAGTSLESGRHTGGPFLFSGDAASRRKPGHCAYACAAVLAASRADGAAGGAGWKLAGELIGVS